ncbi:MAG TPA: mycothiol synthase [Dermatophilaceae bacterium]
MQVENVRVERVERLDAGELSALMALVAAATRVDGVAPLSEQVLLAARDSLPNGTITSAPHFLAYADTQLAGYAHLERGLAGESGDAATAELVVDPGHRRQGVGTTLIHALEDVPQPDAVTLQIWSHGHLNAARALAGQEGYSNVRELLSMRRSLRPDAGSLPPVSLPEGFTARHFIVGHDEDAWLRVNARAFVDHPEQGRMTRLDLDRRIAQTWFDSTGFILVEDVRGSTPMLAASHWTKVVAAEDPQVSPTEGEVYVVGVDPAYQGLGLGRAVTVLGLAHLVERGLSEAVLYVDADNTAAVTTYSRLGFTRVAVDVMYSRVVHLRVPR